VSTLRIIGIGNPDRGDDAVGVYVVDALRAAPPAHAIISTARGDMLALLDAWNPDDAVILVDAMAPASTPGRIACFDAGERTLQQALASFASSHVFNLAETIELGRALGRLPQRLLIFGVEAENFAPGTALSPSVAAAIPALVQQINQECAACTKPP
jgi:hydrogenase maturation protease